MKPSQLAKIGVIVLVIAAVAIIIYFKQAQAEPPDTPDAPDAPAAALIEPAASTTAATSIQDPAEEIPLPRLVDLGADKCIPCKKMAPILEAMREDFAGQFDVLFIDVWKNSQAGAPYRIRMIPTQIFFDEDGNELFRHEGFFSRDDILGKWAEFGYIFFEPDEGAEAG